MESAGIVFDQALERRGCAVGEQLGYLRSVRGRGRCVDLLQYGGQPREVVCELVQATRKITAVAGEEEYRVGALLVHKTPS